MGTVEEVDLLLSRLHRRLRVIEQDPGIHKRRRTEDDYDHDPEHVSSLLACVDEIRRDADSLREVAYQRLLG